MNFIYPKNPKVAELVKANKKRSLALDCLTGEKEKCKWCLEKTVGRKKYCSDDCKDSAWAFFYPQVHARHFLMARQDNKCAHCNYDFSSKEKKYIRKEKLWSWSKESGSSYTTCDCEYVDRGEVDHIIPIQFGGEILGIENVQLLCRGCHRKKTASENKRKLIRDSLSQ